LGLVDIEQLVPAIVGLAIGSVLGSLLRFSVLEFVLLNRDKERLPADHIASAIKWLLRRARSRFSRFCRSTSGSGRKSMPSSQTR
jgi:hypothetical protein